MKLHEIKLSEGIVDIMTLQNVQLVMSNGITNNAQTFILAKCIMAIREGKIGSTIEFDSYINSLFPDEDLINDIKSLTKEQAQQLASVIFSVLSTENVKTGIATTLCTVGDYLTYATASSANE